VRLLAEAVNAFREALKVYSAEDSQRQWVMVQNNLGIALMRQGERTGGGGPQAAGRGRRRLPQGAQGLNPRAVSAGLGGDRLS